MDAHSDMRRHEAAFRAVQKPPAKPWRGNAAPPPTPPAKVYRVEPREFRDLVQSLTGAPSGSTAVARHHHHPQQTTTPAVVQPVTVRAAATSQDQQQQQLYAPSWFSFPMPGMDGHNGNGAFM